MLEYFLKVGIQNSTAIINKAIQIGLNLKLEYKIRKPRAMLVVTVKNKLDSLAGGYFIFSRFQIVIVTFVYKIL